MNGFPGSGETSSRRGVAASALMAVEPCYTECGEGPSRSPGTSRPDLSVTLVVPSAHCPREEDLMRCLTIGPLVLSCLLASQSLAAADPPPASVRFAPFGPGNGMIAVAIDPGSGTLFAGFDMGGLFRSTDGGRSWAWSGQGLGTGRRIPLVAVGASGEVYAVAESRPNLEVFGSFDRGGTWTLLSVLPPPKNILLRQGRLVPGGEPGSLYLALQHDLWKSEDRGGHWWRILEVKIGIASVVAGPPGSREVYVGTIDCQTTVLRSADGGETWKELPNGLPDGGVSNLALSPGPAGQPSKIYVGTKNGLFESADEGATWRQP